MGRTEENRMSEVKHQSLRQLAKGVGVSASYLSQVKNGKRHASNEVLSKILSTMLK